LDGTESHSGAADPSGANAGAAFRAGCPGGAVLNGRRKNMSEKLGVMLCGHGSRDKDAVREFAVLSEHLKQRLPQYPVEYGYLEFATPIIRTGLDKLKDQGVTRVLAVPGMLFAAGHAKNDIPSVLNTYAAANGLLIDYGKELGIDPKMMRAAADRVQEALDGASGDVPIHETLLVVVGRGASDPDANSNVSKVTRLLWEGFGFGWAETAYSGVTFPLVEPGLEHAARLGYRRIIVFPYFLFTGILVDRIYDATDIVAARHPGIEFIKAPYLNDHPQVIATFQERIEQILTGDIAMNCQMCKYRTQVLGFEADVGAVQESHHHHVEGIGTSADCDYCDGVCNGTCKSVPASAQRFEFNPDAPVKTTLATHGHDHSHDHDHTHAHEHGHTHTHAPYPHADHPLGPKSMTKKP
jgi:sirohydrochlorin cobaltochelatase